MIRQLLHSIIKSTGLFINDVNFYGERLVSVRGGAKPKDDVYNIKWMTKQVAVLLLVRNKKMTSFMNGPNSSSASFPVLTSSYSFV